MILRCDRAILSPRRKGSWPLAENLPKGMRFSPPSIRQCFLAICGLHHRSLLFLRLRNRLARQCQERTSRQGAGEIQWPDMRAFPEKNPQPFSVRSAPVPAGLSFARPTSPWWPPCGEDSGRKPFRRIGTVARESALPLIADELL